MKAFLLSISALAFIGLATPGCGMMHKKSDKAADCKCAKGDKDCKCDDCKDGACDMKKADAKAAPAAATMNAAPAAKTDAKAESKPAKKSKKKKSKKTDAAAQTH